MYDLVIVGAGITAATLAAKLRGKKSILVLDVRDHLGGNCYDYASQGSRIHRYGPHIFHTPNEEIVRFLSRYTEWTVYRHAVEAEIEDHGRLLRVPFPYSEITARAIGRQLTQDEVVDKFFKGYSKKMWGMEWDQLPASVKGRVPQHTNERPEYFPGQFCAMPRDGYTTMMERMFEGSELWLGAPEDAWLHVPARKVVYCGRPDRLPWAGDPTKGRQGNYPLVGASAWLSYVSLSFSWAQEDWGLDDAPVRNFCHVAKAYTRATHYGRLTGGNARMVSYETPRLLVPAHDLAPYYPVPTQANQEQYRALSGRIAAQYPNMILAGRLGANKYIDMHQAVGAALALADRLDA